MREMIGWKIKAIRMSDSYLSFDAVRGDEGQTFNYEVYGDCCSYSYFYDFFGMNKLINDNNSAVKEVNDKSLGEPDDANSRAGDVVAQYGIEIVTEHNYYGDQTAVFSFRNDSNGYYGGSLKKKLGEIPENFQKEMVDISNKYWYVIPA